MTDWRTVIRTRLAETGLLTRGAEERIDELASHAEDLSADPCLGDSEKEIAERLLERTDWVGLACGIRRACEEDDMNNRVKRVWLPGAAVVVLAHGLWAFLVTAGLSPTIVWDDATPLMYLFLPWLLLLPLVGALAAYWSRQCGGSRREIWIASLLPALAMAGFLLLPSAEVFFVDLHIPLTFKLKVMFWRGYFASVLVPAALLSLGVLPFLRAQKPSTISQ